MESVDLDGITCDVIFDADRTYSISSCAHDPMLDPRVPRIDSATLEIRRKGDPRDHRLWFVSGQC
jgi:hypothetical protein